MSDEMRPGDERPEDYSPKKKFSMKGNLGYVIAGIVAALVSVALFAGGQYYYQTRNTKVVAENQVLDNPLSAATDSKTPGMSELKKTSESFRQIAKSLGPAVVNIKATRGAQKKPPARIRGGRGRQQPMPQGPEDDGGGMDDPFREFFERFGAPFPHQFQDPGPQASLGSGVIIDKQGYVVTNNHVVEGATEVLVSLPSEKTDVKAKIVGTDPRSDLAVLKLLKGGDFPAAEWADSDTVEVGDWAIAIGSPFALGQSVTVGIVSAKGRSAEGLNAGYGGDLLQTDAAINPGNSGGPLVDLEGKVMGINTAIYTRSGGYMGIGFAIPSNLAKDVVGKLISDGKIVRGWLGVYIQPLDAELGKELGVKDGVGVHEVIVDSPAAKAGLQAGDVIVEVDGKQVKEVNTLQRTIGSYKPGQTVKIKVVGYADKKTRTVTVKVGTLPDKDPDAPEEKGAPQDQEPDKLGLLLEKTKEGMVIGSIQPGSVGDQVGLEPGDIIVRVNRKPVDSAATYKKLLKDSKKVYLEIKRRARTLFFQFALPE